MKDVTVLSFDYVAFKQFEFFPCSQKSVSIEDSKPIVSIYKVLFGLVVKITPLVGKNVYHSTVDTVRKFFCCTWFAIKVKINNYMGRELVGNL